MGGQAGRFVLHYYDIMGQKRWGAPHDRGGWGMLFPPSNEKGAALPGAAPFLSVSRRCFVLGLPQLDEGPDQVVIALDHLDPVGAGGQIAHLQLYAQARAFLVEP